MSNKERGNPEKTLSTNVTEKWKKYNGITAKLMENGVIDKTNYWLL